MAAAFAVPAAFLVIALLFPFDLHVVSVAVLGAVTFPIALWLASGLERRSAARP